MDWTGGGIEIYAIAKGNCDLLNIKCTFLVYVFRTNVSSTRQMGFKSIHDQVYMHITAAGHVCRILKTLLYMLYIIHCNSCIYYVLSAWQGFGQIAYRVHNQWRINKWVYDNRGTIGLLYYRRLVV